MIQELIPRESLLAIGCVGIILICLIIGLMIVIRPKKEEELQAIVDGTAGTVEFQQNRIVTIVEKTTLYQKRKAYLEEMFYFIDNDLKDEKDRRTVNSVIRYQLICAAFGIAATLIVNAAIGIIPITVIVALIMTFVTVLPDYSMIMEKKNKFENFDRALPSFLNNMLLAMQAGSGIEKAMEMSIQTLDQELKPAFNQLRIDSSLYTDDVSKAYFNLAKKIQTKDCERFCNVVISGLKNGNKMSDIFRDESAHLNKEQLNKMMERASKNKLQATAISTGLIFMPVLVILIAPLMVSSM